MTGAKYKDLIVKTIDHLRKKKAKPDLEKICCTLQKQGLSFEHIVIDLEKLVEDNIVQKIEHKGSVSFRNVDNSNKTSSFNQDSFSNTVEEAVKTLSKTSEPTNLITVDNLERYLNEDSNTVEKEDILNALKKLIGQEKIIEKEEGVFGLNSLSKRNKLKRPHKEMETKTKQKHGPKRKKLQGDANKALHVATEENSVTKSPATPSPSSKKGRPPTKRKRIKKTHGPDFETYFVPSKASKYRDNGDRKEDKIAKQVTPISNTSEDTCDFCLGTAKCNKNEQYEELLFCVDCGAKAHPSCMQYEEPLISRIRSSPWQCLECKICNICQDSGDAAEMLICDSCDKGYHMDCHVPAILEKPDAKCNWSCAKCIEEGYQNDSKSPTVVGPAPVQTASYNGDSNSTVVPTPSESPIEIPEYKPPLGILGISSLPSQSCSYSSLLQILPSFKKFKDVPVPDASTWSIEDVVNFFNDAGFPEEANVFQEQEIDGTSLLLMKRSDVLEGLNMKLGPALKIYAHIQRLQSKGQLVI